MMNIRVECVEPIAGKIAIINKLGEGQDAAWKMEFEVNIGS